MLRDRWTDGLADMTKLIVAFRKFANASKKCNGNPGVPHTKCTTQWHLSPKSLKCFALYRKGALLHVMNLETIMLFNQPQKFGKLNKSSVPPVCYQYETTVVSRFRGSQLVAICSAKRGYSNNIVKTIGKHPVEMSC